MPNKDFINSKISCPVCNKTYAKNYLLTHLKTKHSNIYTNPEWTDKYLKRYYEILRDNRQLFNRNI